jgi:Sulfotransferase family
MSTEGPAEETQSAVRVQGREHVPPIFVTGVWRCGATLLYLLLNQHPDIALFYESDLPMLRPMFRISWGRKAWVDKWEYWNASVSRHDLDPARLASPVRSLADAFELAGREYAGRQGKKRWGCKSPSYFDQLEQLAAEFPDAQFIVVWRDPEEICRSAIKAAGGAGLWFARPGTNHKLVIASRRLKNQVDKLLARGASVHQIHYRDLVSDNAGVMRSICEFLRVPFDPAVTALKQADRTAVFSGAHHALARGSSIVSSESRHEPLPAKLANKIARYRAHWKAEDGDTWLLTQRFAETSASRLSLKERVTDRLLYMALRTWDIAPRFVFSMLPLSVWQTYRRLKYKDAQWVHRQITNKPTTLGSRGADDHRTPL